MEDKNIQFLDKIDSLPEEARAYFYSQEVGQISQEIIGDYNIDSDSFNGIFVDFFISNFNINQLEDSISNVINKKDKFICDFLGKLFFPVEPFINSKFSDVIINHGAQISSYEKYIEIFNDIIDEKNLKNLDDVLDDLEKNFSFDEEEFVVLNFLEKDLIQFLRDDDFSGRRQINGSIIHLLKNKKDSLNKFTRAFLNNQEKLTSSPIALDGKKQEPTIANWIKRFIRENGSEMFSNISLVKYLTSSPETASLNDDDKKVLKRMLKTYRNLIFFPDSMKDVPMINWEILPIESDVSLANQEENIKPKITKTNNIEKKIQENKPVIKNLNTAPKIIKKPTPQLNLADQELEVLQKMLKKYPNKSLERKAIEGEIKKRKKA